MPKPPACPDKVNVLLIGGGGREHALGWKIKKSGRLGKLWIDAKGHGGLAPLGECCPIPTSGPFHEKSNSLFQLRNWCEEQDIGLIVVGPEIPLAQGIHDALATETCLVFGPPEGGARLEADKVFAKKLMRTVSVPTADGRTFTLAEDALEYVRAKDEPCVIKASGLAAGKGVMVCPTLPEAEEAITRVLIDREFGDAGNTLIVEEMLTGPEVSVLALTDGNVCWILDPAKDHKRVGEADTGPNTGGMGAYCPAPVLDEAQMAFVEREIFVPTLDALKREGIVYRGVLYAGLMLTKAGPKVLEFNCRFGDPECQPLLARLKGDIIQILWDTAAGNLANTTIEFDDRPACCVVMCSAGYPGTYEKGKPIAGIDTAQGLGGPGEQVIVFHAGTKHEGGEIVTNGGRVLSVTALASDLERARMLANEACAAIEFEGAFFRSDIGAKASSEP
ncbi:MAG: phosphoribosylamine--glycine ligase [Phycisphaerae bacterium]|nr:phosphoribosylamine--glycine ligase [Phycisphaerae bacterium]